MEHEEAAYGVMYRLLAAWLHGGTPEGTDLDYDRLLAVAMRHKMTATVCMALEDTGLMDRCPDEARRRFAMEKTASIRASVLMGAERRRLLAFLEEKGIWYMPLKGILLQECYPRLGARQMSDNDILFDESARMVLREHMVRDGYKAEMAKAKVGCHDAYTKPPVYRFEMHRWLFYDDLRGERRSVTASYYADVKSRLIKDADNGYGYHFRDEDLYVYLLAHIRKHYDYGGIGVRVLLDLYLYRQSRPGLDESYMAGELDKLGLRPLEALCRSAAEKLFAWPERQAELTDGEMALVRQMERSGVYGTVSQSVQADMRQAGSRGRFLWRRVFPDITWYRTNAPFAYSHRWALPFFWVYRLFRGCVLNGKHNLAALRVALSGRREGKEP